MDKLIRFVECLVPISKCNLRCSYCYVIQENRRDIDTLPFKVSPKQIGEAFTKERWGGTLLVNLCGFGETLILNEMPEIIYNILKQGHYINVTNNGTISKAFDEIIKFPSHLLEHLCFAFSLHYLELKKRNMLDVFVENVNKVRNAGCSFLIQINLCDEYIECKDEIKSFCNQHFGALPQVALTRKEGSCFEILSNYSYEEYRRYGYEFESPLFEFTCNNFNIKRKEFCYAGDWTFKLDLASGDLKSCIMEKPHYNIYANLNEKIKLKPVGNNCKCEYCINSSHYMSLGVIPEIVTPSYVELRDRNHIWYGDKMYKFLNQKLYDNNNNYSWMKRKCCNFMYRIQKNE